MHRAYNFRWGEKIQMSRRRYANKREPVTAPILTTAATTQSPSADIFYRVFHFPTRGLERAIKYEMASYEP